MPPSFYYLLFILLLLFFYQLAHCAGCKMPLHACLSVFYWVEDSAVTVFERKLEVLSYLKGGKEYILHVIVVCDLFSSESTLVVPA